MTLLKKILPFFLLCLLSSFALLPLFKVGFFSMHDSQQIARLFELDKALLAGQFPVRWVSGLGFGYGYALFNFYPPLTYYVGELVHLVGFSFIDSIKAVWLLSLVGSALAMYFFAKEFFGKLGALVAATFYLYAPYHAVDAYVRGALAELASFVWLPLILLFAYKTTKTGKLSNALLTGVFLGLLMVTHNLIFLPFFGVFTCWYFATAFITKQKLLTAVGFYLLAALFAFGLTAFFWLPALGEKQFTLVDGLLIKNLASYKIHFVCPSQLWDSAWGYGGSVSGCVDGLSFKLGKLHVFAAALSILVILKLYLQKNFKLALTLTSAFVLLLGCIFMTLPISSFVWDHITQLWYLQFPWRFLEFVALFTSFLAGSLVLLVSGKVKPAILSLVFIFLAIFINAKLFTPQDFLTWQTDKELTSKEEISWRVSSTSFEYMPKEVATTVTDLGTLGVAISHDQLAKVPFVVTPTNSSIVVTDFSPDRFNLSGKFLKPTTLRLNQTNFPGWKIWVDGKETKVSDANRLHLMTISLTPGHHTIVGLFTNTPIRILGNALALISLLILLGLFVYDHRRHRK